MDQDKEINFRLMANPRKLKNNKFYIKNDYLKLYLNDVFKTDTKTINNLTIYIENIIKDIDINQFIEPDEQFNHNTL